MPRNGTKYGPTLPESRRPPKKRRVYNKSAASLALAPSAEHKFLDTTIAEVDPTTSGAIISASVNLIPQDVTESGRVGRRVILKAVNFRFVAKLENTSTPSATDDGIRVIIYHDRQANGATAAVSDILSTTTFLSFNNLGNKSRFTVLSDKIVDLSSTAGSWDGTNDQFGEKAMTKSVYLKCDIPLEFSGTAANISNVRSNNIGIMAITDAGKIKIKGVVRARYMDL